MENGFGRIIDVILKQCIMRNIFILFSFVLVGLGLSIPGAQDEIITKNGDVSQECNVETIDKYLLYNTENKTDGADDEPNSLLMAMGVEKVSVLDDGNMWISLIQGCFHKRNNKDVPGFSGTKCDLIFQSSSWHYMS